MIREKQYNILFIKSWIESFILNLYSENCSFLAAIIFCNLKFKILKDHPPFKNSDVRNIKKYNILKIEEKNYNTDSSHFVMS